MAVVVTDSIDRNCRAKFARVNNTDLRNNSVFVSVPPLGDDSDVPELNADFESQNATSPCGRRVTLIDMSPWTMITILIMLVSTIQFTVFVTMISGARSEQADSLLMRH